MNNITTYLYDKYAKTTYIYIRVRINKQYFKESLNLEIEPKFWDEKKHLVKSVFKKADDYNLIINQKKGIANNILVKYRLSEKTLDLKIFKKEFKNPAIAFDFIAFIENEFQYRAKELSYGTMKHERSFLNILKEFKNEITFSDLTEEFVSHFLIYLKSDRKNGIARQMKQLTHLKFYIDLAIKRGLMKESPFKNFRFKSEKKLPVFLEEPELLKLIELYKSGELTPTRQKVLRWYLFACLGGGMRISDLRALTFDKLISKKFLVFSPIKIANVNPKIIRIELSKPALQLIKDEGRCNGVLFNMYKTDQITNRVIKQVFKIAGIERKKISFHSSRHTFAVMYLVNAKSAMAFPTLSKILGHSTVKMTMDTYVGVTQLMLDEGMQNFNKYEI